VLEAAKTLLLKDPSIKFLIAGGGSLETGLRHKGEEFPNVVFTGFVSDIYRIENIMDLQLNASYGTEATSLSLLEGMSLGIPAVVSDFGGNPYVIEHGVNGLIVRQKDAAALADAIEGIKTDRATYEAMAAGAERIFSQKFTSRTMTCGIEQIYDSVIQRKRG
jgi:glycosyltransferase involved in cell wall biosynthesis